MFNGIPGTKVDVCIDGKEVRSGLRYGRRFFALLLPAIQVMKIYKRDPRTCKGQKLAQKRFDLKAGDDLTVVVTRKSPKKIVVFDNSGLGGLPSATISYVVVRHASDIGAVSFKMKVFHPDPELVLEPAADAPFSKGNQFGFGIAPGLLIRLRATRPDQVRNIAKPPFIEFGESRRYEVILVGTKKKNTRFLVSSRAIVFGP